MVDVALFADYVSSLALLLVLAAGYGGLRRSFFGPKGTEMIGGLLFGVVAILQMHTPIEMVPGVIIDLRNVPVALAGAFLGLRGTLVTLGLAILYRMHIGGMGLESGVAAMIYTALIGRCWHARTIELKRRTLFHHIVFAVGVSTSLWCVILLPSAIALRILSEAAILLVPVYLVVIPLVGLLIDREVHIHRLEQAHAAGNGLDEQSGLLTAQAFRNQLVVMETSMAPGALAGVAAIKLNNARLLGFFWGTDAVGRALAALRLRLSKVLQHTDTVGVHNKSTLLVPLTHDELANWDQIKLGLRETLCGKPLRLTGAETMTIDVSLRARALESGLGRLQTNESGKRDKRQKRAKPVLRQPKPDMHPDELRNLSAQDLTLFDKAELMIKATSGPQIRSRG